MSHDAFYGERCWHDGTTHGNVLLPTNTFQCNSKCTIRLEHRYVRTRMDDSWNFLRVHNERILSLASEEERRVFDHTFRRWSFIAFNFASE